MGESSMLMTMCSWRLVVSLVVMIISSVLSSFNFDKLLVIHVLMSLMQASTCDMVVSRDIESHGLKLRIISIKVEIQTMIADDITKWSGVHGK